jgi:dihydroorotase
MIFDLAIRGAKLVHSHGIADGNVGVRGGLIEAIAPPSERLDSHEEIDASGKYVLPGLVDAHVHIPGFLLSKHLDNFESATKAAAAGGVTTVLLMPTDDPRTATAQYFERKRDSGTSRPYVDYGLQALIGPMTESVREMADLGAVSFELFLAYGGMPHFIIGPDDYELERVMGLVREVEGIVGVTPHSPSLITRLTALHRDDPAPTVETRAETRTVLSETLGIARACTVAERTGAPIHVRALSSIPSIEIIKRFKDLAAITAEVMSHHLLFDAEDAKRMGAYGVITPPLRQAADRAALRQAVRDGSIEIVVSDHSPCLRADKERGPQDIWKAPPGMPGLQTLCASMLSLVDEGHLSLSDLVRTCCENPAKAFRLHPRKGEIIVGGDADLIILDSAKTTLVRDCDQFSKADYTTLNGRLINWAIERVLVRGQTVFHHGKFAASPGGRFVRP